MRNLLVIFGSAILFCVGAAAVNEAQVKTAPAQDGNASRTARPGAVRPSNRSLVQSSGMSVESQNAMLKKYCMGCHNDTAKKGGMTLTALNLSHPEANADLAEKVIKKLRAGMMPPVGNPRPAAETAKLFFTTLEAEIDRAAALHPNPGYRSFQRLTRDEYAHSVHDLLGIDVDVAQFLPPDTVSEGMDNIADNQTFSAALMEGYTRAAAAITRQALGDPEAEASSVVYKIPRTGSQTGHMDGTPIGTRGGTSVLYNFPADGEYGFRGLLFGTQVGALFGNVADEQLEISIDGERVALLNIDPGLSESSPKGLNLSTGRIFVKAGSHRVAAAFLQKHSGVIEDIIAEHAHTLADDSIGGSRELTIYPHLRELEINGPHNVTGVSDTPARRRVFICRPLGADDELPCATKIVTELTRKAYRRPVSPEDLESLIGFYQNARKDGGDFEAGIRSALEAILASVYFVARVEQRPSGVQPGQIYRISDLDLASRLSYFLWSTAPDDELLKTAIQGKLKDPTVLERQVRRMLRDPKSESLSTKFAAEWLHLPDLDNFNPDSFYYPEYDHTLALALRREVELFFDSIVREDRNIIDLLTADYTFVNERLAKHYGIPNITGSTFQRITLADDYRRGLLGKAAILTFTSIADRTSPVLRGKWVMGVLLGTPPPPPPPAVPSLDQTASVNGGKTLTVRQRMEAHRANAICSSCHNFIDPIGLALENFDVTGRWRTWDKTYAINSAGLRIHTAGVPVDSKTKLYDGTALDGPASLRQAIVNHSDMFIANLTEKLMSYALGRRIEGYDMPSIRSITRAAANNGNRFSSYVIGIVKSPAFQMSKAEILATETANKN